jgi:hypothetical protein
MENNDDRRTFPRFNILVDVSASKRASEEKEQTFSSKNISQGGVCIISFDQPTLGDIMDLKIRLPGKKDEVKTMGKVVWVKEITISPSQRTKRFEVGLEFIGLSDSIFAEFNNYLYNNKNTE